MSKTERLNTLVIGGGQAGLVTGYHLRRHGVNFAIVDAAPRVGDSWRNRWDSLRLFTFAYMNNLPGMPFPAESKLHLPTKDEVVNYLEQYAAQFSLPVRFGTRVERLSREGERYVASTDKGERIEADNVVVATGPFQSPRVPEFAGQLDRSITQLHSSAYRNPSQLRDGDTLVVGAATSGCDIAMELAKTRRVFLSGPGVDAISRGKQKILRHIIPWVYSRPQSHPIGKKLFQKARHGGHPLIGYTYKEVGKAGVTRLPRITGVSQGKPVVEGGQVLDVANVIWATGYKVDFSWVDRPIFEADGYPRHVRGVVEEEPGLYFVGLIFLHSLSSQLMMGVGRDTQHVADELVRRSAARQPAPVLSPGYQTGGSSA